jgi:hypothetical protein
MGAQPAQIAQNFDDEIEIGHRTSSRGAEGVAISSWR